jgi:hypothetical protein
MPQRSQAVAVRGDPWSYGLSVVRTPEGVPHEDVADPSRRQPLSDRQCSFWLFSRTRGRRLPESGEVNAGFENGKRPSEARFGWPLGALASWKDGERATRHQLIVAAPLGMLKVMAAPLRGANPWEAMGPGVAADGDRLATLRDPPGPQQGTSRGDGWVCRDVPSSGHRGGLIGILRVKGGTPSGCEARIFTRLEMRMRVAILGKCLIIDQS